MSGDIYSIYYANRETERSTQKLSNPPAGNKDPLGKSSLKLEAAADVDRGGSGKIQ